MIAKGPELKMACIHALSKVIKLFVWHKSSPSHTSHTQLRVSLESISQAEPLSGELGCLLSLKPMAFRRLSVLESTTHQGRRPSFQFCVLPTPTLGCFPIC